MRKCLPLVIWMCVFFFTLTPLTHIGSRASCIRELCVKNKPFNRGISNAPFVSQSDNRFHPVKKRVCNYTCRVFSVLWCAHGVCAFFSSSLERLWFTFDAFSVLWCAHGVCAHMGYVRFFLLHSNTCDSYAPPRLLGCAAVPVTDKLNLQPQT